MRIIFYKIRQKFFRKTENAEIRGKTENAFKTPFVQYSKKPQYIVFELLKNRNIL